MVSGWNSFLLIEVVFDGGEQVVPEREEVVHGRADGGLHLCKDKSDDGEYQSQVEDIDDEGGMEASPVAVAATEHNGEVEGGRG